MTKQNSVKKAVALKYNNSDRESAPKVVAKGKGLVAEEILDAAKKHKIHIQEDPGIIELLSKLEIDQQIPEELYEAVAEIFAFIYKIDKDIKE